METTTTFSGGMVLGQDGKLRPIWRAAIFFLLTFVLPYYLPDPTPLAAARGCTSAMGSPPVPSLWENWKRSS
jgi:hypothetical protein